MTDETQSPDVPAAIDPKEYEELKSEVERLRQHSQQLLGEKKQQQEEARKAAEAAARKSGDLEALEKSWQQKLADREAELKAELEKASSWVADLTVGQAATQIASEIAITGSAKALLPHIRARLGTDIRDGRPVTVVLDEDGKPSALTLDELKDQFRNDAAFAPLIVGSKASGAGGAAGRPAGSGNTITRAQLDKMSPREKAQFYRDNPKVSIIT